MIDGEQDERREHEVVGEGRLDHTPSAVQQHQNEVDRIAQMDDPERTERVPAGVLDAEDEDEEELQRQQHPSEPCNVTRHGTVAN